MSEENIANKIARQLFAMSAKKRESTVSHETMSNERYPRTWTDEIMPKKARPGRKPLSDEQRQNWERFHFRGEK